MTAPIKPTVIPPTRPQQDQRGKSSQQFVLADFDVIALWASPANGVEGGPTPQTGGAGVPTDGGNNAMQVLDYTAVSIDPLSDFRALNLYFDGEQQPYQLFSGHVVKRRFSVITRVETLYQSRHITDAIGQGSGQVWTPNTRPQNLACPQRVRLRYWLQEPLFDVFPFPVYQHLTSSVMLTQAGVVPAQALLGYLHLPGVRTLEFWCSNNNTGNAGALTINVASTQVNHQQRYIYPAGRVAETALNGSLALGVGNRIITTLTLPAAADSFAPTGNALSNNAGSFQMAVDPGDCDFYLYNSAGVSVGPHTIQWGVRATYNAGA